MADGQLRGAWVEEAALRGLEIRYAVAVRYEKHWKQASSVRTELGGTSLCIYVSAMKVLRLSIILF